MNSTHIYNIVEISTITIAYKDKKHRIIVNFQIVLIIEAFKAIINSPKRKNNKSNLSREEWDIINEFWRNSTY